MKNLKCPYNDFECKQLNTKGENQVKECSQCNYYNQGVRATGAAPILAWIVNLFSRLIVKPTKDNPSRT